MSDLQELYEQFVNPPRKYKSRPLWFWNADIDQAYIEQEMTEAEKSGYAGVAILPATGYNQLAYLSDEYFAQYKTAVDKARDLGLKLCLYDEFDYPSGSIGAGVNGWDGQFNRLYPNDTAKRLDKLEEEETYRPAGDYVKTVGCGTFMGAIAINRSSHKITVLSTGSGDRCLFQDNELTLKDVPLLNGIQSIMIFMCVKDHSDTVVDYLEPEAVSKFINAVHQKYYDRFAADFGTVIDSTFYDEPRMWGTSCDDQENTMSCKMWTARYNSKFEERFGFSPVKYYPALWYDIGQNTQAARNMLFGFRADLFAEGYLKTINDWCAAHGGIKLQGHIEGEESINPTGGCGDLIKVFKYQDIPGIDEVFAYNRNDGTFGRTARAFKIVSSSAYNYDKELVMTETNGASGQSEGDPQDLSRSVFRLYKEAFDQLAKGINSFVPHAIIADMSQTFYMPDLSHKNIGPPNYAAELNHYNDLIGRCQLLLQGGRHIADIALLYPIASLQAGFRFDSGYSPYRSGGAEPMPEADYMHVGELLSLAIRRDFTYLHPEIIMDKCDVRGDTLFLDNQINHESFKVMIIPGGQVISADVLLKIKRFYDQGGKVIFSKCLPSKSAEPGRDAEVIETINSMLGKYHYGPLYTASSNFETGDINCMYEPSSAGDGYTGSCWMSRKGDTASAWLEIDFQEPLVFDQVSLKESGSSVSSYSIQSYLNDSWYTCYSGIEIGDTGAHPSFPTVLASKVRLKIKSAREDTVSIRDFQVFHKGVNITFKQDSATKHLCRKNGNGGKTYFIPNANQDILRETLDDALPVYDVDIPPVKVDGGNLSYIHKENQDMNLYYFANSSDDSLDLTIQLRGIVKPDIWNPHTGEQHPVDYRHQKTAGKDVTKVSLQLEPIQSLFLVSQGNGSPVTLPSG